MHYLKVLGSSYPLMQVISHKNGILSCVTAEESKCEYISSCFQMVFVYVLLPLAWTFLS